MKKLLNLILLISAVGLQAQIWKTEDQYIQKFAQYAVEEMEMYKIPASIKLAQGLLETGGGQSRLAQEGKNHFGIKCKENWTGKTMKHTDDAPNECFRVYEDPRESYRDHSLFLATRKYYTPLFSLDGKDYKAWAYGLKKAGYATNPRYAEILISKIEKYRLYEFDNANKENVFATVLKLYPGLDKDPVFMAKSQQNKVIEKVEKAVAKREPEKVLSKQDILNSILVKNHPNGGLKFFIVPENLDLKDIADKFKISQTKLMKYNELDGTQLPRNSIVFLESKKSRANVESYRVQAGETMYDVAQKFAVKLSKLYSYNRMSYGQQPKVGDIVYMKKKKPKNS